TAVPIGSQTRRTRAQCCRLQSWRSIRARVAMAVRQAEPRRNQAFALEGSKETYGSTQTAVPKQLYLLGGALKFHVSTRGQFMPSGGGARPCASRRRRAFPGTGVDGG